VATAIKHRSPLWARLCVALGCLLLAVSGGSLLAGRVLIRSATGAVQQRNLLGTAKVTVERQHAEIHGAKNILLVGIDTRPGWNKDGLTSRSDSIILMHIPADRSAAYLISLPRDSYVAIPAYDNGKVSYQGGHNKINAAFALGSRGLTGDAAESHGFELLALTVRRLTGITPDAGAIIDFNGFTKLLGLLGKVCMYVDENVTSIHVGHTADGRQAVPYLTDSGGSNPRRVRGVTPNFYAKGTHCFTPAQALDFARQRDFLADGDSDYGRQRHQQQLLKAMLSAAVRKGLASPARLPSLLSAVGRAMTVDDGGISLEDWAFALRHLGPDDLVMLKTNGGEFHDREVAGIGSVETFDETSLAMLHAARDDDLATFTARNPDRVASSS
jgi:anionic cell wall polymer biosynthesis LytR-Cps2A-Psr (LCP) family protein